MDDTSLFSDPEPQSLWTYLREPRRVLIDPLGFVNKLEYPGVKRMNILPLHYSVWKVCRESVPVGPGGVDPGHENLVIKSYELHVCFGTPNTIRCLRPSHLGSGL